MTETIQKRPLTLKNPVVHQRNENCQVFNGPISGCVFAMPGATVHHTATQQVSGRDATDGQKQGRDNEQQEAGARLSATRQNVVDELFSLADRGDWTKGVSAESVKSFLLTVLGYGEPNLNEADALLAEKLWCKLESGRGKDRVRVFWQNLVGYMDDYGLLLGHKSSPVLNLDFFGDKEGADNINKGRPSKELHMSQSWREVLPLLDRYRPQLAEK